MYIVIKESALRMYTGFLGTLEFKNGVSVDHVSKRDVARIKSTMHIETIDAHPSELQKVEPEVTVDEPQATEENPEEPEASEESEESEAPVALYKQEELEAIADKEGISGLREIAEKHGIKGRSIAELIEELMAVKA